MSVAIYIFVSSAFELECSVIRWICWHYSRSYRSGSIGSPVDPIDPTCGCPSVADLHSETSSLLEGFQRIIRLLFRHHPHSACDLARS